MDVDLSVDPSYTKDIADLLNTYDIVVASRYNPVSKIKRSRTRAFLGAGFSVFARVVLKIGVRDTKCGFKGFRREVLKHTIGKVHEKGWFWDTEFIFIAKRLGYTLYEMPVPWYERKESNVHVVYNIFEMLEAVARLYFRSLLKKYWEKNT